MFNINCSKCGHLFIFHHRNTYICNKESRSGCHFTIDTDNDKWLECDCEE